jgi:hypothetical protein
MEAALLSMEDDGESVEAKPCVDHDTCERRKIGYNPAQVSDFK